MVKVLIDTSIFIDFLRTGQGQFRELVQAAARDECVLSTSSLVLFEIWQGKSMQKRPQEEKAVVVFKGIDIFPVTEAIAKMAGELSRQGEIGGIDSLIAATALSTKAELATLNSRHFKNIKDLELRQP